MRTLGPEYAVADVCCTTIFRITAAPMPTPTATTQATMNVRMTPPDPLFYYASQGIATLLSEDADHDAIVGIDQHQFIPRQDISNAPQLGYASDYVGGQRLECIEGHEGW